MVIRGTTPTVIFTFTDVDVGEITKAILTLKQDCTTVVEKDLSEATVGENSLSWLLSQEETLALSPRISVLIVCDWLLSSGIRGRSKEFISKVGNPGKNEVI